MSQHVAIFGATSAIASELARRYAARGDRLYLVGRNEQKLTALVRELGDAVLGHHRQDFDQTQAASRCIERAVEALGTLHLAVIAHGLLGDQAQSERDVAAAEQIAHTNYTSVVALLVPLANYLERQGAGHIAVLSSVAADRGRPRNYTYASAKAALNVYLQGLRSRLHGAGVQVHTIKLGPVDTPMTATHAKNPLFAQSAEVAEQIEAAIDQNVPEAYVPPRWRAIMFVVRNLPEAVFQRVSALSGR